MSDCSTWAKLSAHERARKCQWFRDQLRIIEERGGKGSVRVRLCIVTQKVVTADRIFEEFRITLEGDVALRLASRWAVFRNNARDRLEFEDLTAVLPMAGDKLSHDTQFFLVRTCVDISNGPKLQRDRPRLTKIGPTSGQAIFLIFWATWCTASHVPLANVVAIARKHYGDACDWPGKVSILSVSLDNTLVAVTRFLAQNRLEGPHDPVKHCWCGPKGWNGAGSLSLGVKSLPCALLLDGEMRVLWRGHPLRFDLEEKVQALLDGPPGPSVCLVDDGLCGQQPQRRAAPTTSAQPQSL